MKIVPLLPLDNQTLTIKDDGRVDLHIIEKDNPIQFPEFPVTVDMNTINVLWQAWQAVTGCNKS